MRTTLVLTLVLVLGAAFAAVPSIGAQASSPSPACPSPSDNATARPCPPPHHCPPPPPRSANRTTRVPPVRPCVLPCGPHPGRPLAGNPTGNRTHAPVGRPMPCPPPPCPHRPAAAPANGTGNGTHRPGLRLGEGCRHGPGDPHAPDMRAARRVHAEVRMMESMVMLLERIDARVADLTAQMEANGTSAERLARLEAQLDRLESLEARILAHLDEMTAHVARIEAHYAEEPVRPAPDHPEGRPDHGGRPSETGRPSGGRPPR